MFVESGFQPTNLCLEAGPFERPENLGNTSRQNGFFEWFGHPRLQIEVPQVTLEDFLTSHLAFIPNQNDLTG